MSTINNLLNPFELYTLPFDDWVAATVQFLVDNFRPLFQAIRLPVSWFLGGVQWTLLAIPPLIFILLFGLLVWQGAGRKVGLYTVFAFGFIGFIGAWEQAIVSLALVITAVIVCIVVGVPLGIVMARSDRLEKWLLPLLDGMQTLPSFVYLVPIVMLFGIGEVPGVIATVIFAVPPLIRLTSLGIRQVSKEVIEAAIAFGSSPWQVLWEAELPLALPTILTGVNQSILMALSMSVVTSMIAVPGLGQTVLQGVGRLDVGLAAVGGIGIVLLAVMLDRITQAIASPSDFCWYEQGLVGFCRQHFFRKHFPRKSPPTV